MNKDENWPLEVNDGMYPGLEDVRLLTFNFEENDGVSDDEDFQEQKLDVVHEERKSSTSSILGVFKNWISTRQSVTNYAVTENKEKLVLSISLEDKMPPSQCFSMDLSSCKDTNELKRQATINLIRVFPGFTRGIVGFYHICANERGQIVRRLQLNYELIKARPRRMIINAKLFQDIYDLDPYLIDNDQATLYSTRHENSVKVFTHYLILGEHSDRRLPVGLDLSRCKRKRDILACCTNALRNIDYWDPEEIVDVYEIERRDGHILRRASLSYRQIMKRASCAFHVKQSTQHQIYLDDTATSSRLCGLRCSLL